MRLPRLLLPLTVVEALSDDCFVTIPAATPLGALLLATPNEDRCAMSVAGDSFFSSASQEPSNAGTNCKAPCCGGISRSARVLLPVCGANLPNVALDLLLLCSKEAVLSSIGYNELTTLGSGNSGSSCCCCRCCCCPNGDGLAGGERLANRDTRALSCLRLPASCRRLRLAIFGVGVFTFVEKCRVREAVVQYSAVVQWRGEKQTVDSFC